MCYASSILCILIIYEWCSLKSSNFSSDYIDLWTVQPRKALETLQRQEHYKSLPDFEATWGQDLNLTWGFKQAYLWMAKEMASRIPRLDDDHEFPVWAWARAPLCKKDGSPDFRSLTSNDPTDVVLHLKVKKTEVLLSDHGTWHHVLNGIPITLTEQESDRIEQEIQRIRSSRSHLETIQNRLKFYNDSDAQIMDIMEKTWLRIFDIKPFILGEKASMDYQPSYDPGWIGGDDVTVQACIWRIEPSHLVSWRHIPTPKTTKNAPLFP